MAVVKKGYSLVKVAVISRDRGRNFYYQVVKDEYLKVGSEYIGDLAGEPVRVRVVEMDIDPAEILEKPWDLKELHKPPEKKKKPPKRELPPGAVEEWKPIYGYEGIYEISNTGRVRSLDRRDKRGALHKGREIKVRWDDYYQDYFVMLSKDGKHRNRAIDGLIKRAFNTPNEDDGRNE